LRHEGWEKDRVSDQLPAVQSSDCVVIITDHTSYAYDEILENAALIVDTRNALGELGREHAKVVRL
jgi:UDP-N-acetyl-D-glucosamine dehydrogenase